MKCKNLFIDLDNTLWDTFYNNKECLKEMYTDDGFNRYFNSFEAFYDYYTSKEPALRLNHNFLERTTTKTRLIPGALELLEYLRPSYKMYILSNGFREVQFRKLVNSGLAPYFLRMILSEDANIQKPHRKIFDFALVNTNSRRSETLMIGDSWEADIVGARNAGIAQLWFNPEGLPAKGFTPTYTVRSLAEIKDIL
jgi:putative hydrolase of the HAD superfamily